jgi:hypothetical protein
LFFRIYESDAEALQVDSIALCSGLMSAAAASAAFAAAAAAVFQFHHVSHSTSTSLSVDCLLHQNECDADGGCRCVGVVFVVFVVTIMSTVVGIATRR